MTTPASTSADALTIPRLSSYRNRQDSPQWSYGLILPDTKGHGRSDKPRDPQDYDMRLKIADVVVASTSNGRLPVLESQEPPAEQSSSGDEAG